MGCVLLGLPIFTGCRGCHHFLGGLCGGYVGVSCLGGNTTLCKPRSELNVDIIYIPIKICGVYGVYLRVYEVLSVSLGLVLIPCVNALACQSVGNVEFVGCCWRIPGTITITGTMCICTSLSKPV